MHAAGMFQLNQYYYYGEKDMSIAMRVLIAVTLVYSFSATANEDKGLLKEDAQVINAACEPEAAAAGCGGEVVGKGLLKCLHSYKKAHQDFKFSAGCRGAMKRLKEDKEYQDSKK